MNFLLAVVLFILNVIFLPKFSIIISLYNVKVSLTMLSIIIIGNALIIEYKKYNRKDINSFYLFIFWFLYVINIFCLFIMSVQVFFAQYIVEYLINIPGFSIYIEYTYQYKWDFMHNYIKHFIECQAYPKEKKEAILKIIVNLTNNNELDFLLKNSTISLNKLLNYIPYYIECAASVYDLRDMLTEAYEKALFYNSDFYHLYCRIRNILGVIVVFKTIWFSLPTFILHTFFLQQLVNYIKIEFLFLRPAVVFLMTSDEFDFFCRQVADIIMRDYFAFYVLDELLKYPIY